MTKPITEEQVDRLIESLPPMYDKDFKQSFKNCINQTRNQAVDEQLKDIIKLNNKVYDPIELEILLEKKLNLGGKPWQKNNQVLTLIKGDECKQ